MQQNRTKKQPDELSPDEAEGLALTQAQILDAYNAGSTDKDTYFTRMDALEGPFVHTDEDA